MRTKNISVNLDLCEILLNKLQTIENCCKAVEGLNYIMTITSGKDGIHSKNSLHYVGKAIDIRSKDMINIDNVCYILRVSLGKDFDIIKENDHIHIEYDINNNYILERRCI